MGIEGGRGLEALSGHSRSKLGQEETKKFRQSGERGRCQSTASAWHHNNKLRVVRIMVIISDFHSEDACSIHARLILFCSPPPASVRISCGPLAAFPAHGGLRGSPPAPPSFLPLYLSLSDRPLFLSCDLRMTWLASPSPPSCQQASHSRSHCVVGLARTLSAGYSKKPFVKGYRQIKGLRTRGSEQEARLEETARHRKRKGETKRPAVR